MSSPTCIQAVVFAFRGTLASMPLDMEQMYTKAAAIAAAFDICLPQAPTLWAALDQARDELARSDRDIALEFHTRCRFALLESEVAAARQGRMLVALPAFFSALRQRGLAVGVVSTTSTPVLDLLVPHWQGSGALWVTRETPLPLKPDPAPYSFFRQQTGLAPEQILAVGAHPLDMWAPRALGWATAGIGAAASEAHWALSGPAAVEELLVSP